MPYYRSTRRRRSRHLLDYLETRILLSSTLYVANSGNDANPGTAAQPFATIQAAAWRLQPGDILNVMPGTYAGFVVGWDSPGVGPYGAINGTPAAPITIQANPGSAAGSVIIQSKNAKTADGIDLESSSYLIVQGFTVNNATATITRAGIRSVTNTNVTIRNNVTDHNGTWGIFTGFSQNLTIDSNITSNSGTQHGIYVSNSADNPIVRNNISFGNSGCGIQLNSDVSQGGDGIISNALIDGNVIYNNGVSGGSGINLDGVQNSRIQNNLLYNNHASGISLFQIDGAQGAKNNLIVNNTIVMPAGSRWAVNIMNASTGNVVYNNILMNNGTRGSIDTSADSRPGLVSDYNAVIDRLSPDDSTVQTLAQWRTTTGQDAHSFVTTTAALFVNKAAGDNYHLSATSPAIDAGTNRAATPAPVAALENFPRPIGANWDIGAYERDTVAPTGALTNSPLNAVGSPVYTFTVTFSDNIAVNSATLDGSDILVTGPGGFSQSATFVSSDASGATYRISEPGATWTTGTYTAHLQTGQVADTTGNFVPGADLGTLPVAAFSITPVGDDTHPVPPPTADPAPTTPPHGHKKHPIFKNFRFRPELFRTGVVWRSQI